MKLSNVVVLYGVRLRARLGQELLALVGIAVGVSLLFAALVANTSLSGSADRMAKGIFGEQGYQLAGRGSAGLPETTLREVQGLPGVKTAAAILEVRGELRGPSGSRSIVVTGVGAEFAHIDSALTRRFSADYLKNERVIALPSPLGESLRVRLGQPLHLQVGRSTVEPRLGALLQRAEIGSLVSSPLAIAPLRYAQELTGRPGEISRVFAVPHAGMGAVVERGLNRVAAGRANVHDASFDAALFRQASEPTNQSTGMFSVFSAMVGFLFAFSAVLLTVPQRRRLIADLNTEGYGPSTAIKILAVDALILGVVASALGLLLGDQVSRRLFAGAPNFLEIAFPVGSERIVTASSLALAAAGGILASCVAVLAPTATAVGAPNEAERSRSTRRGTSRRSDTLVFGGLLALAIGIAIVVEAPDSMQVGIAGLVFLTLAMLALLPALLLLLVSIVSVLTRRVRSVVPFLALSDLADVSTRTRTVAVAATGAVAIFGSVALQGAHADLQRGLDRATGDLISAGDLWVSTPGESNLLATTSFRAPPIEPPAGIETIATYRGGFLDIDDRRVWVFGAPTRSRLPVPRGQTLHGDASRLAERIRAGGWAAVSEGVARELGVSAGDRFTLPSPVPMTFRVAALTTNMGWPPGSIVLNADDYARAWGSDDASALIGTLAPGTSPAAGKRALSAALGSFPELVVETSAEREVDQRAASRRGLARLTQIAALVLVSAVIAMAAAMAGMIWQRRSFLAAMKVEGYGATDLWRSLLLEASILIGAGCAIGAAFGLLGQRLLSRALTSVTGFPVRYELAASNALLSCLAVTAAAVAIVAVFGYRAAHVPPESGLHE